MSNLGQNRWVRQEPRWLRPVAGGEEIVVSFKTVTLRERKYLFLIVMAARFENNPHQDALQRDIPDFGKNLGASGAVVSAYEAVDEKVREEVLSKSWGDEKAVQAMRQSIDPFILVINQDFERFDPQEHEWALLWLSNYEAEDLNRVFAYLVRETKQDEGDVFRYLKRLAARDKTKRWIKYFEFKPHLLGVSLDVGEMVRDKASF
jgi:hypothetical protein